jgi:cell division protein FtsB
MHARKRDFDKKIEDFDERLSRVSDEADTHKRKNERLSRENNELKKQVETFIQKEDRTILQYEKIMDQLKSEIKDKERQCHTIETREAYAR